MTADEDSLNDARACLQFHDISEAPVAFIRKIYSSDCKLAVVPMQDLLGLDGKARMNYPGSVGGNWKWRLTPGQLNDSVREKLTALNTEYARKG